MLAVGASLLAAVPVHAEDVSDAKAAASLTKAFIALCIDSMADLDQLERSAGRLGWRRLEGAEAKTFAAPAPDAKTKTWDVQHYADVPFWLSVTHGMENGKGVSVCTIINSEVAWPPVKTTLVDMLELKHSFREDTAGTQEYTYWQMRAAGASVIVSLTNTSLTSAKGVNIAATLIQRHPAP